MPLGIVDVLADPSGDTLVDPFGVAIGVLGLLVDAPMAVAEFRSTSVAGVHINSMGWLAVAGERRVHLRSIFRSHRLQREEDEIRRMQKRAKRRPIDRG